MKTRDRVPGLRVSLVRDGGAPVPAEGPVNTSERIAALVRQFIPSGDEREHFVAVYLDNRQGVKGVAMISIGTLSASLVHPREVFRPAIVAGAAAVVVSRNHPSGDPTPSSEDRDATRRLQRAGEIVGIPLVDHVIVTADRHYGFRENGIL